MNGLERFITVVMSGSRIAVLATFSHLGANICYFYHIVLADFLQCPGAGLHYTEYTNACDAHCRDLSISYECDPDEGIPGCVCENGSVVNEAMDMCVPKTECRCVDEFDSGIEYPPGFSLNTTCKIW